MLILAVDPGARKCGLALLDGEGGVQRRQVVSREESVRAIAALAREARPEAILVGRGTTGEALVEELRVQGLAPEAVDETGTTLEGRDLWESLEGRRGWRRFLPRFLRLLAAPSVLDDWAAVALGRRWLRGR